MSIDHFVLAFAGPSVLVSLSRSRLHSVHGLRLAAFVGANLLQSAFTRFCPLAPILKAAGARPGVAFE